TRNRTSEECRHLTAVAVIVDTRLRQGRHHDRARFARQVVIRTAIDFAGAIDANEGSTAIGIGRAVLAFGQARRVCAVAVLARQIAAARAAGIAAGLTEGATRLPADANP